MLKAFTNNLSQISKEVFTAGISLYDIHDNSTFNKGAVGCRSLETESIFFLVPPFWHLFRCEIMQREALSEYFKRKS